MRIAYATRIPIRGFGENCSSTVSFLDGIFSARVPASQEGKKEARGKRKNNTHTHTHTKRETETHTRSFGQV